MQTDSFLCSNLYFSLFRIIYTVAQKLSHRYVHLSIIFYNCSYTKPFKTLNGDQFKQPIMATLMQNPFQFQSAADHLRH